MGLQPRRCETTQRGGTWEGVIDDESTRSPILELLEYAIRDQIPVSWLPDLSDARSVVIETLEVDIDRGLMDVSVIGGPTEHIEIARGGWILTVHFRWAPL